jgi:hypothetical protein
MMLIHIHDNLKTGSKFLSLSNKTGMFYFVQFLHEFCAPQNSELLWQSQNNTKYNSTIRLLQAPRFLALLQVIQWVNFKNGTSNGGKHTTSCIHNVLTADHKRNKRYQRLGAASRGTRFIRHSSKSSLQLPSSNTQQNTVIIYLKWIPFTHNVKITNKYHIWEWVLYGSGSPHTLKLAYNSDSPGNKPTTKFSYCHTRWYMETVKV